MSERKIVVPEGMLTAAYEVSRIQKQDTTIEEILEAALRWLSENPIVPTDEQLDEWKAMPPFDYSKGRSILVEFADWWQRRMFVAQEPEIPEEIRDLLWSETFYKGDTEFCQALPTINKIIIEAFRRGQRSK